MEAKFLDTKKFSQRLLEHMDVKIEIICDKCSEIIQHWDEDGIVGEALTKGWRITSEDYDLLCKKCAKTATEG